VESTGELEGADVRVEDVREDEEGPPLSSTLSSDCFGGGSVGSRDKGRDSKGDADGKGGEGKVIGMSGSV
jgi:hypothetical protein